jgi:hypothetical protein
VGCTLGTKVGASGREDDAPTGFSPLSTDLVDYGHLILSSDPCQPHSMRL